MQVHFLYRNVLDTVVILEEENPPGNERQASCHSPVCQGSGVKEAEASGGRDEGELREGLQGIRGASGKCDSV